MATQSNSLSVGKDYNKQQIEFVAMAKARDDLSNAIIPHYLKIRDKGPVLMVAEIKTIMSFVKEYSHCRDIEKTKYFLSSVYKNSIYYSDAMDVINKIDFECESLDDTTWPIRLINLTKDMGTVI